MAQLLRVGASPREAVVAGERDAPGRPSLVLVEESEDAPAGIWRELWRSLVRREQGDANDDPVLRLRRDLDRSRASPGYRALCAR